MKITQGPRLPTSEGRTNAKVKRNTVFSFKLFETTRIYQRRVQTFSILLGVAVIAYRVFVKRESIIVRSPNWKMRGLACLVMGLSLVALSVYFLIAFYLRHVPILSIQWIALAVGVFITVASARIMMRVSPS
jgi:hypothetical protein